MNDDFASFQLAGRMIGGDRVALSRLLTMVENETEDAARLMQFLQQHVGRTYTIGITGPPGSGKSTLVARLTSLLRSEAKTVGIVALDPSSPFSGGAVLGDRIRMQDHTLDPGVFIRSLATRGNSGGLARTTRDTLRLLDASGKDFCIVETVGVGQVELDVLDVADTVVVVSMPGTGDSIQAMKAGILEIADILAVNKSDLDGAERLASDLEEMIREHRRHDWWQVPVTPCQAHAGIGVDTLLATILDHRAALQASGQLLERRKQRRAKEFLEVVERKLKDRLHEHVAKDGDLSAILAKVMDARIDPHSAAVEVLGNDSLVRRWLRNPNGND